MKMKQTGKQVVWWKKGRQRWRRTDPLSFFTINPPLINTEPFAPSQGHQARYLKLRLIKQFHEVSDSIYIWVCVHIQGAEKGDWNGYTRRDI